MTFTSCIPTAARLYCSSLIGNSAHNRSRVFSREALISERRVNVRHIICGDRANALFAFWFITRDIVVVDEIREKSLKRPRKINFNLCVMLGENTPAGRRGVQRFGSDLSKLPVASHCRTTPVIHAYEMPT